MTSRYIPDINYRHYPGELGFARTNLTSGDAKEIVAAPGANKIIVPTWYALQAVAGAGNFSPNIICYWDGAGAAEYEKHVVHKRKLEIGPAVYSGFYMESLWPKFVTKDMTFAVNKKVITAVTGTLTNGLYYVYMGYITVDYPAQRQIGS